MNEKYRNSLLWSNDKKEKIHIDEKSRKVMKSCGKI
jgi:hypothetical protein